MKKEVNLPIGLARKLWIMGEEFRELALQVYDERQLDGSLPRSWTEYLEICQSENRYRFGQFWAVWNGTDLTNLNRLILLRDYYRGDWVPDWEDDSQKYCIHHCGKANYFVDESINDVHLLAFPSLEMAEDFLKFFEDYIRQVGDLI